ncbi:MAG: hypothetical protein ABLT11_05080 [Candidatus Acidiferrum sp.]
MKLVKDLGILVGFLAASAGSLSAVPKEAVRSGSAQHFVCNTGYTLEKCRQDVAVLRRALEKYPVEQLGEWTWVLVRSSDWKSILTARGLDRESPAFTYFEGKETFFEEALVTEVPERQEALLVLWGMSMPNLLNFAVAHELGHALCNEKDESKAERVARMLREGKAASCEVTLGAKGRHGKRANHLDGHTSSD